MINLTPNETPCNKGDVIYTNKSQLVKPSECAYRYYLTDTCGLTDNTCYRNREEPPDCCPLLRGKIEVQK